jgi:hypothetical protein
MLDVEPATCSRFVALQCLLSQASLPRNHFKSMPAAELYINPQSKVYCVLPIAHLLLAVETLYSSTQLLCRRI